jgi:uncharacterized protein (DUF2147 family)
MIAKRRRWRLKQGWLAAFALGLAAAAAGSTFAQQSTPILGRWLTENRDGVVELYPCAGKLCGRLVWMKVPVDRDGKPQTDVRNPKPDLRTRPLCGLAMMGDFAPKGSDQWDGGWIYSPQKGETYAASMRLEGDGVLKLHVGGGLIGRTQTWTRADPNLAACPAAGQAAP